MIARSGCAVVDGGLERVGVAGLGHDLVPGVDEQAGEPLAEQRRVLADHDAHGTTASTIVPRPSSLLQRERAADRVHPVGEPGEPGPGGQRGAAPAVVGDAHLQVAVAASDAHVDPRRRRRA